MEGEFPNLNLMRHLFFVLSIFLISCADPIANKYSVAAFESELNNMIESAVLSKEDARKIRCTGYLAALSNKDLAGRSYQELLNSYTDESDALSFAALSKQYAKTKLDSALSYEVFKIQKKRLRGRVYYGFKLKNETKAKVLAYSGVISISDLFGKLVYSGPFENQRKHLEPNESQEFWIKLDKSNCDVKLLMKDVKYDFKYEPQAVIFEQGKSWKVNEFEKEATEEFEKELKTALQAK